MTERDCVLILAGPSGAGKTTVMNEITRCCAGFELVRSMTTRKRRNDGNDGEYIYTAKEEFLELLSREEMLEFTEYAGNYYGTPYSEIKRIFASGKTPLLILDMNGVHALKKRKLDFGVYSVYIYSSPEELSERLGARYFSEGERGIELYAERMRANARDFKNMRLYEGIFDSAVMNTEISSAVSEVVSAYEEKRRDFSAEIFLEMAKSRVFLLE